MKKLVSILLILVLVFSLSAAVFAATDVTSPETGNTDVDNNNEKPSQQTGDTNTIFFVAAALLLAVGAALFCGKKLVSDK